VPWLFYFFIIGGVELADELEASLREIFAAGTVEIRENEVRVSPSAALSWEVRGAAEKPLLHLWSEQCNLTRRVLAITDHSGERLALAVERFGRSRPDRLEFVRRDFERPLRDRSREEFCAHMRRILPQQFPDETLESLSISPDLEHSLSGNYARGLIRRGALHTAVLAVPDGESADTVENSLTFALLWLEHTRRSSRRGSVSGLRLILPKDASRSIAHRFAALDPRLPLELYERDAALDTLEKVDPRSAGNIATWLVSRRETQALLDQAQSSLAPICALASHAITLHPSPQSREVCLRFRGLAFARWEEGRVFFGADGARKELTPATQPLLQSLLHDLEIHRNPLASDTRHTFYRSQAERWLESLVRDDVSPIDPALDPEFVYSQVFAHAGGEHGILDLLSVTRSGRLAILELKATEHVHLPLQAADYWLRIRRHLAQDDFPRYGYFSGVALQPAPPLLYLVAPALRFHPATDTLLRYLTPELEVVRVGLAESWRRGLRVVMRQ
jgi:hypothetical protein